MKQPLRIDISYTFDGLEEDAVWTGSRQFEKTQKAIIEELGGDEFVMAKEIVSDNYARYVVHVQKKQAEPQQEELTKGIPVKEPKEKKVSLPKGGKPLPKVKTKKVKFSMKKGRLLKRASKELKLGGRK